MIECHYKFKSKNFDDFFNKKFNESFAATVIKEALLFQTYRHGNDLDEPDFIFDEKEWFEIALICDSKKKNNLIQRIIKQNLKSDDVEEELLGMIRESVEKKSQKNYIDTHPNLCLICPLPIIDWISDEFDAVELIFSSKKRRTFDNIYTNYVKKGIFKEVFLMVPDIAGTWWMIDLKNKRIPFEGNLQDKNYPYYIMLQSNNDI